MKLKFLLAACVLLASGSALCAADKRWIDLPELAEAPAANDWLNLWDTSFGDNVKISRANFLSGAALSANNITSGTLPDARLSANVSQLGPTISLAEMATMATGSLLGRATAGTGAVEVIPLSGKFVFNFGQLDLAQAYILDDPQISDLSDGSLDYQLGLVGGYSLQGKPVVLYPPMTGTVMDLSLAGETLVVTSSVTLTHSGAGTEGQYYVLHLVGDGVNTWTVTPPAMFSSPDEGPAGPITVNPQSNLYIQTRKESSQWVVLNNPPSSTGSGPTVLRDYAQINSPSMLGTMTFQDGVKQTFNPNGTNSGFNPGSHASDPTVPADGDMFYRPGVGMRVRSEGTWITVGEGGGGLSAGDFDTAAKLAALLGAGDYTGGNAFVRADGPTVTGTWNFASIAVSGVLSATSLRLNGGNTDGTLSTAGDVGFNTLDEQISIHSAADGEISGEAAVSLLVHKTWSFDPKAVCDGAVDRLFLMTLGDDAPEGIKITEWKASFEADPTTEIDLDLKYADAFIGVAGATVIDALDTTAGVSSEDTNANINGGAAVANGKVLYLEFGTAYTEANHQVIVELWYYAEED